jgi:ankyrin repeat protein
VKVTGAFGRTILHDIAAMGDWVTDDEVAAFGRAALEAGGRVDRRDEILKSTPLGWACRWGRVQLAKLLIKHGADPEENDSEPWARPRSWALKMGHDQILPVLR